MTTVHEAAAVDQNDVVDVVLVGGGIMSATLGAMLSILEPDWRIVLVERASEVATESSDPWNNAGTGHAGYCELNYMPDPSDSASAADISRQFHLSRRWWSHLVERGLLDPATFIHGTPHVDLVFGDRDISYLRRRFHTLSTDPLFEGLEFTDVPETIRQWAPLTMAGRDPNEPVAATRHDAGTDVDFGSLTRNLVRIMVNGGGKVLLHHDVRALRQGTDGTWLIRGRRTDAQARFRLNAKYVFIGAGGYALRLLQRAHLPEVRGYGVLPIGAAFLRCSDPHVVAQLDAKVYGRAPIGAPPMSVPHLDKRIVDGHEYLLFGPYATFSTRLLKHGKLSDFFTTLRWHNLHVLLAATVQNLDLVRYLLAELFSSRRKKVSQLLRFYPAANPHQWELIPAGQRAQLITPDAEHTGALRTGTELVVSADRTIAGVLGASPGASTAVPIMLNVLQRCFPERWRNSWRARIDDAVPNHAIDGQWSSAAVTESFHDTAEALGLNRAPTGVNKGCSRCTADWSRLDIVDPVPDNLPFRRSCRGVLVDGDRILLAQHSIDDGRTVWVGPGGGVEDDESLIQALARELHEETGLMITAAHAPRLVWVQTVAFPEMHQQGYAGVANYFFLVHVDTFEPISGVAAGAAGHPDGEGILAQRWWSLAEIGTAHSQGVLFSPRALPTLIRSVLTDGPPPAPIAIGL